MGKIFNRYNFRQFLAGFVFLIDSFLTGAVSNFSGTLLAQLEEEDSEIHLTTGQSSWIVSIISLGVILATLINVGYLQLFGRKWSYLIIATSNVIFWCLQGFSTEVWHLIASRGILGFNAGLSLGTSFIYIIEAVEVKHRNIFLNIGNLGVNLGILFADIMGTYVKWQTTSFILSGMAVLCVAMLLYLENTHIPYLQKGEVDKAAEQYFWYRKKTDDNWDEFNSDKNIGSEEVAFAELKDEWKRREFIIPLLLLVWLKTTAQFTGGSGISSYSVQIMREVVSIDEYLTVIITDVLCIIATFGTMLILEITRVRLLLNVSSIVCTAMLVIVSLSLYLGDTWNGWSSLAVAAIWIFNFCLHFGYMNMYNVLFGILFTGVGKTSGMAIISMYSNVVNFSMGHLVPVLMDGLGLDGMFMFFAGCTIVGGVGIYFIMPEVKGKNSEEIRLIFTNYSIRNVLK